MYLKRYVTHQIHTDTDYLSMYFSFFLLLPRPTDRHNGSSSSFLYTVQMLTGCIFLLFSCLAYTSYVVHVVFICEWSMWKGKSMLFGRVESEINQLHLLLLFLLYYQYLYEYIVIIKKMQEKIIIYVH